MRTVLIAGVLIMVTKFVAYFLTHSNAIFTDALESIINVVAGAFAYYSLSLAAKPKDHDHPYGHGKIEFISAGFEGGLILLAGVVIIIKSVFSLITPAEVGNLDIGIVLAGVAGAVNYFLGRYIIRIGKESGSLTLIADGKHLVSDTYSSIGLVAGLIIIRLTNIPVLDSILAIVFGGVIIVTGYKLVRRSLAGLMDEADEQVLNDVVKVLNANRADKWIDIHNLRILQYGSSYHIDCHLTLPWYDNLRESHEELKNIEVLIRDQFHNKVELFIHPDPCLPQSCSICSLSECRVRQHPFQRRVEWNLENLLRNEKHGLDTE